MCIFDEDKIKKILEPIVINAYEFQTTDSNLYKNTLDIFSSSIESAIKGITFDEWLKQEKQRQIQKTLQNKIGELHQQVLGTLDGVTSLDNGNVIDLEGKGFIAEIKNKHNTTKGNHKIAIYDDLENELSKRKNNFIAYYVEILPKNGNSYNQEFTPSDNRTSQRRQANPRIRKIDGQSFYEILTGDKDALRKLYKLLPKIVIEIINEKYNKKIDFNNFINESEFNRIYGK